MKSNEIIDNLLVGNRLRQFEVSTLFGKSFRNSLNQDHIKAALALIQKRGARASELSALAQLIRKTNRIDLALPKATTLCDACGTGGDHAGTFNISTVSSIVAAAAGATIAKHGNRSITSKCGSSDLIEALGINLESSLANLRKSILSCNLLYLHAPRFSKKFKSIQPIRRELAQQKIKTIFNLIGPLVNPLKIKRQVVGIYKPELVPVVANALMILGVEHALVFSGIDSPIDELIPGSRVMVYEVREKKIKRFHINWKSLGLQKASLKNLRGGTTKINRRLAVDILTGRDQSVRRDTVLVNAAAILYISGIVKTLSEGVLSARNAINSGRAYKTVAMLRRLTHGA